jgi:hypothetical protein
MVLIGIHDCRCFSYENSDKQRWNSGRLLFVRSPDRPRPRIYVVHDASLAVNFREEQQKTAKLS